MQQCPLENHIRTHTAEKPFECIICNTRFTQKGSVTRHMDNVHNLKLPFSMVNVVTDVNPESLALNIDISKIDFDNTDQFTDIPTVEMDGNLDALKTESLLTSINTSF